jgi:pilus assembly protein Flp/PilA
MLKAYVAATNRVAELKDRLAEDRSGAALVEYSVLIGLITVAAIVSIGAVGTWVAARWGSLVTVLGAP